MHVWFHFQSVLWNYYTCLRSKPRYRYGHLWYVLIRTRLAISGWFQWNLGRVLRSKLWEMEEYGGIKFKEESEPRLVIFLPRRDRINSSRLGGSIQHKNPLTSLRVYKYLLPNNHEVHRCLHRHLRRSRLPRIGCYCSALYVSSFTNLEIDLINVLFSRRRPRCTSFLICTSHEISLIPSLGRTFKNLKCECICLRLLAAPIVLKYSWLGPNDLICCGPLINGVGTWVNLSLSVNHFTIYT